MYRLLRRRAKSDGKALPLSQSGPPNRRPPDSTSIEFVGAVMSLDYEPQIDLQLLRSAGREHLGQGGSFRVERAFIDSQQGQPPRAVVIKRLLHTPHDATHRYKWNNVLLEIEALLHPPIAACRSIVDLLAIGWEEESVERVQPILIMPHATFGTLDAYIYNHNPLHGSRIAVLFDIGFALDVLHECGIVHGDLKSENVLVFLEDQQPVAKLSDFGCSIINLQRFGKITAGTPPWNCPEWQSTITAENLPRTDIYSFGLLVWRTLSRVPNPFRSLKSFAGASEPTDTIVEELKSFKDDRFLNEVTKSLQTEDPLSERSQLLEEILSTTIRHNPGERDMSKCLRSLEALLRLGPMPFRTSIKRVDNVEPYLFELQTKADVQAVSRLPWALQRQLFKYYLAVSIAPENQSTTDPEKKILSSMWLFLSYLLGVGVQANNDFACHHLLTAARCGDPVAKSLSYRAIVTLCPSSPSSSSPSSSSSVDIVTIGQWLGRSLEMGYWGAKEDFTHLCAANESEAERILKWYQIALERLRCCTAGVGKGYFLVQGQRLNPFRIESQVDFRRKIQGKRRDKTFDINAFSVNSRGDGLLHLAATCGFEHAAAFLIQDFGQALDVNVRNVDGETPLLSASRAGQSDTVLILLNNGADLRPSNLGESPLHWLSAFETNSFQIGTQMLVSVGESNDEAKTGLLHQKAFGTTYSLYWSSRLPGGTPLHRAVHSKLPMVVETLLRLGADPLEPGIEKNPESALQLACIRHYADIVAIFLDHMNISDVGRLDGIPLLHLALSTNDKVLSLVNGGVRSVDSEDIVSTVDVLMCRHADPGPLSYILDGEPTTRTALFEAVKSDSLRCVDLALSNRLLTSRTFLDMQCGIPARSPLNVAVENGSLEIVEALVNAGANTKSFEEAGMATTKISLLHSCSLVNSSVQPETVLKIFNLLVPEFKNVDIHSANNSDCAEVLESPFVLAVRFGRFDLATALLERGADIDFPFTKCINDLDGSDSINSFDRNFGDSDGNSERCTQITILGALLSFPSPSTNSVIKFLLGYDGEGRKKKDWQYKLPSPVVSKHNNWTIWHAVAFRRARVPLYDVEHVRELTRLLSESYPNLGQEFLDCTCRNNTRDDPKQTALHVAVERTNPEVVVALLRLGAACDVKDADGHRPIDYARRSLQGKMELEEELGWSEYDVRREIERRTNICVMFGT